MSEAGEVIEIPRIRRLEVKSKKPICPLYLLHHGEFVECIEEKCAWWDARLKVCAVKSLADVLNYISDLLEEVKA